MQKIVPNLWFDKEAKEAANFYVSVFPDSKITSHTVLKNTPSGDCDIMGFDVNGFSFMAISAGPLFKLNPSISFMVNFDRSQDKDAIKRMDEIWVKLSDGGKIMMPMDKYPFSQKYGWIQDKYGVSWQLILMDEGSNKRPFIVPALMYTGEVCGKAEEATDFYMSVFKNSSRGIIAKYPPGSAPDTEDEVMYTDFQLEGQWCAAMDSALDHGFKFNEAVSLMVKCKDQVEIDYFWNKMSAVPEAEQCGWIKDKYGVSWQITSNDLDEYMTKGTREQVDRVTQAFLPMKKFDLAAIKRAYEGK